MTRIAHAAALGAALTLSTILAAIPAAAATESVLYSFPSGNSGGPAGRLLLLNGAYYGTASGFSGNGTGQVFQLYESNGSWTEKTILPFSSQTSASAGLIADSKNNLYGTTAYGGTHNAGTVFELTYVSRAGRWSEQVLWNFGGTGDGTNPYCDLVMDSGGNLYGTTLYGGASGNGMIFELSPSGSTWSEAKLHSFAGGSDGANSASGLIDIAGTFYGTTISGGAHNMGTVFDLYESRGVWNVGVLHAFAGGTTDGATPYAGLIADANGGLYGTTYGGGVPGAINGWGTVFELKYVQYHGWENSILYKFPGTDGGQPASALSWGSGPNYNILYGAALSAGSGGGGAVFQMTRSGNTWSESPLYEFTYPNGYFPQSAMIVDASGNLIGTAFGGGQYAAGVVYKIVP